MSAQIIFIGEIQRQCKFALIACDAMQKSLHQMGQEIDKEKQLVIKIEKCQEGLLLLLSVVDSFNPNPNPSLIKAPSFTKFSIIAHAVSW
jgi:hypothetical protein